MNVEEAQQELDIALGKYLADNVIVDRNVSIPTMVEPLTANFLITFGPKRFALRFIEKNREQDRTINLVEYQAAALLGSGIGVIYDFKPNDIARNIYDCLYVVARFNPELFSQRGIINIYALISDWARRYDFDVNKIYEMIWFKYYDDRDEDGWPRGVTVFRFDEQYRKVAHWGCLLDYIERFGDKEFATIDQKRWLELQQRNTAWLESIKHSKQDTNKE